MRLILHIGGGKCGSSAIQVFLRRNVASLKFQGVLIPSAQFDLSDDITGQQIWFFDGLRDSDNAVGVVADRLEALRIHMQWNGLHTLVVSAENLMYSDKFVRMLAVSRESFDVQIVAYVRRQDDYLLSAWQQWYLKTCSSLENYLSDRVGKDADWAKMMAPWEDAFGRDRIVVRRFQRSALVKGDAVDDFLSVTELPHDDCVRPSTPSNPSFDEHLGELAHRVRDLFSSAHDNSFFEDMFFAIGPKALKDYSGSILLPLDARQRILGAYNESNRILREKYFPYLNEDEPLFEEASERDVVTLTELERLRYQQDMLVRAIAGLAKRMREKGNR